MTRDNNRIQLYLLLKVQICKGFIGPAVMNVIIEKWSEPGRIFP